ncbi:MAG: DEAD/DEAH box helicase family protein [Bacteroidales bacterium]|nr:DEAD/DEAH box helicase family protein [Bacteroidales bacterium]
MSREFIVGLKEHRIFGWITSAYWIEKKSKDFSTIVETINETSLNIKENHFSAEQKKLIEISSQFSESEISKLFSKKKITSRDFFNNLKDENILSQIREYIDRRLVKYFDIVQKSDIRLFYKSESKNIYNEDEIIITKNYAEAVFNFERTDENSKYFLTLSDGNSEINLTEKAGEIIINSPCVLLFDNNLYFFKSDAQGIDGKKLQPFFTKSFIEIPKSAEKKYFESFVLKSIENYKVNAKGFIINELNPKPKAILLLEKDWQNKLNIILKFEYNKILINKSNKKHVFVELIDKENYTFNKLFRNFIFENEKVEFLNKIGLENDAQFNFKLKSSKNDYEWKLLHWLNTNSEIIINEGFEIRQSFYNKKYLTQNIKLDFNINENKDWFDLKAIVHFGEYSFPFTKIKNHILNNNNEFVLPNGEIAIIPEEWFSKFSSYFQFGKSEGDIIKIKNHHFSLIDTDFTGINENLVSNINNILHKNYEKPTNLNASFREYQKTGYNWLNSLYENNFGACLSDDMGLGKTLQTLAFIQNLKEKMENKSIGNSNKIIGQQLDLFSTNNTKTTENNNNKAGLIVMPTSLIHNWNNEIQKFTPKLNVLIYNGILRDKSIDNFNNYDLILTSFGILRNDIDILEKYQYCFLIVDESQFIKNPNSKIYRSILKIDAGFFMALTGTPIENSLTNLWAQMNFTNNGLLGSLKFFTQEFINPIEKQNDELEREIKQKKLKKIINPFILRRTKQEVAKDLPDLTETVRYCSMSEDQENFYEAEKSRFRNLMLENIEQNEKQKNNMLALQGLTKLRQIANHPLLVDEKSKISSGKFDEIISMLESLMAENHKVLIFSTFVKHLELFEEYFKSAKWRYSILTGQTVKREEVIDEFQNNEENKIFLISLKAGGSGLNLTSAEYVFIIDPWWNPAAELQAISRAHRIGQKNKVFAYRFICENTIEQKIVKLQDKKKELAELFINENNPFGKLSQNEILDLFN